MMTVEDTPIDNVYVAGLPADFTEEQCRAIFGNYGTVTQCKTLPGRSPGGTTSAALVRFATVEQASWVVQNLNGNIPQGLAGVVQVKFANAPPSRVASKAYGKAVAASENVQVRASPYPVNRTPPAIQVPNLQSPNCATPIAWVVEGLVKSGQMPGGSGYKNDTAALYVAGLPYDTQDVDVYRMFSPFGAMIAGNGVVAMKHADGSCRGNAFVNYLEKTSADMAILTLNGTIMPDSTILKVVAMRSEEGMAAFPKYDDM